MKKLLSLLRGLAVAAVMLSTAGLLYGQELHFTHFNKEDNNLAYNSINTIFEDSRGYVWIGTHKGLSRYDGVRFKNYDKSDLGVASDFVSAICEDNSGNLWIGTDKGASIYRYDIDNFISSDSLFPDGARISEKVYIIRTDSRGVVWLGTREDGLYKYDPVPNSLEHVVLRDISVENVYRFEPDKSEGLFVNIYCDNIYRYSPETGLSLLLPDNESYFAGDDIEGLVCASGNLLYVASKRHGLCEVNLRSGEIKTLYRLPQGHRPLSLSFSDNRWLWMGCSCGLLQYDTAIGAGVMLSSDPSDSFSLSGDQVTSVCPGFAGRLWVGTLHNGLNLFDPGRNIFRKVYRTSSGESLKGVSVRNFIEDKDHKVWVATEKSGLFQYNPASTALIRYRVPNVIPQVLTSLCAEGEYLWIGAMNGIYKLLPGSGVVKVYNTFGIEESESDNRVITFFKSANGDLYAGTTAGVVKYDRIRDSFRLIACLAGLAVENMAEDASGDLWLASYASGVFRYDTKKDEVKKVYPLSGMISSVTIDSEGGLWVIGFSDGFFHYNPDLDSFSGINRASQPMLPSDVMFNALDDGRGQLWITTDNGLVSYKKKDGSIRVYTENDGLLSNVFKKSALKLSDGTMIMGSEDGFIHFDPRDFERESRNVHVVISDMYIGGESVSPSDGKQPNFDLAREITLAPNQASFEFLFSEPGASRELCGRLFCRLKGYEKAWKDVSVQHAISWYNLPPATYTLQFKMVNTDGWAYCPHPDVEITVEPGFWRSALGIILTVLIILVCAALLFALFYTRAMEKEKQKQAEREMLREKETFNEKMAFFSGIVHEIKTPLTLIHTPLSKIMAGKELDQNLRKDLKVISDSTDYMDHLVKELLEFVRVEKHGYDLVIKTIDIVEKLGFMCFNFAESAKARNVRFTYRHRVDSILVEADESALNKILNNLLHNAVKYAESYIDVHVYQIDGQVSVTIRNDGPQIPPERREDIFKPFVQFSAETTPYSQSFGIGLSLARSFAELHKGTLFLDTSDETCTKFVLRLPAKAVVKTKTLARLIANDTAEEAKPLIMIAEDNEDLSSYLKSKLQEEFRIITAPSAETALSMMRKYPVDLLVTDIAMRNMSGIELCRKVNSDIELTGIPVIVVSAISSDETKIACMEAGAVNYIEKPFNLDYLLSCMRAALDRRATTKKNASPAPEIDIDISRYDQPGGDTEFLLHFEKVIQENLGNSSFSNKQMEDQLFMSHSTLNRKVKTLLDTTPNEYLRDKRLDVAAQLLESSERRINEICFSVGFNSPSYFSKCFKDRFGMLPAQYRQKYSASEIEESS